jgi:FTR1 family protein
MTSTRLGPARAGLVALLALAGALAAPAQASLTTDAPLEEQLDAFRTEVREAVDDYREAYEAYEAAGNASTREEARANLTAAGHRVGDAFLAFEQGHGDDGSLSLFMQSEIGSGFYRSFEQDVVLLRATMLEAREGEPATPEDVETRARPVFASLDRAESCLPDGCGSVLTGAGAQSFLVLLREGGEAILLVGAIVAYLHKTDRGERTRTVWGGVATGVGASAAVWFLLDAAFSATAARSSLARAVVEGATMLLAAAILFYVSFWLLSKVEAERWQSFIDDTLEASLADDRAWMLGLVGFLAVFREGVETAVFVQAIAVGSGGAWGEILAGLGLGAVALVAVYLAVHRYGVRVPLRRFFAVTGAALALLSVRFLGLGLFELQEAGVLGTTAVPTVGDLLATPILGVLLRDVLGVSPTLEVLVGQGLVVGVFAAAGAWTVGRRFRRPDPARA